MPKLKHYDDLGSARFVTFCCYRLEPYLLAPTAIELLIKHLDAARLKHHFRLLGYVIMPEHVHLVLVPAERIKLGLVIREIKSRMAREFFSRAKTDEGRQNIFWQKRCYDHNCRTVPAVTEKIDYCHNNPVRRRLVTEPAAYQWSSHNWYEGKKDVPLKMDDYELQ
jgi:putative transposase